MRSARATTMTLVPSSPWWGEQRSRYHFAAACARGATVLDIECGTGFGSEILADAGARFVTGVDSAVGPGWSARPGELTFIIADGAGLPFIDGSFDLATSFGTIEHIGDERALLRELRRVLRPAGRLVLSTPNSLCSPRGAGGRAAHTLRIRAYAPEELRVLLREHFGEVTLVGQITKSYYPVSPFWEDPRSAPPSARARLRTFAWKLLNRLPFSVKDGMSRLLHNRAFFPGEFDFDFLPDQVERAHVTVAVCRP